MREIKFRAWDKVRKEWLPRKFYISFNGMVQDGHPSSRNPALWVYSKADVELMQFTGLKDKNGKEIYEGDILQNGDAIHSVTFSEAAFWWGDAPLNIIKRVDRGVYKWGRDIENMEFHEVIGNIYENAELLESTKTK